MVQPLPAEAQVAPPQQSPHQANLEAAIAKRRSEEREKEKFHRKWVREQASLRIAATGMALIYAGSICLATFVALSLCCIVMIAVLAAQEPSLRAAGGTRLDSRAIVQTLVQGPFGSLIIIVSFLCSGMQFLGVVLSLGGKCLNFWVPRRAKVQWSIVTSFLFDFLGLMLFVLSFVLPFVGVLSPLRRAQDHLLELTTWASWLSLLLSLISFIFLLNFLHGVAIYVNRKKLADEPLDIAARFVFLVVAAVMLLGWAVVNELFMQMPLFVVFSLIGSVLQLTFLGLWVACVLGWLVFFPLTWIRLLKLIGSLRKAMV
jgi:hypothetical protein